MISIYDVAKTICEEAGWNMTHLKLQKILYIMQMFHLGRNDKPLFYAQFATWKYGPVEPTVYQRFCALVAKPIPRNYFSEKGVATNADERPFVDIMLELLLDKTAIFLVNWTHESIGAWAKCYKGKQVTPISNEEIKAEYKRRMESVK